MYHINIIQEASLLYEFCATVALGLKSQILFLFLSHLGSILGKKKYDLEVSCERIKYLDGGIYRGNGNMAM